MRQTTIYPGTTTIVSKSSRAATMLAEGREQLGQMGININLDATATDINSISFENGINGTMTKTTKKSTQMIHVLAAVVRNLKSVVVSYKVL